MDKVELNELMEAFARQDKIVTDAKAIRDDLEQRIIEGYGDRDVGIFSYHAHVARKKGNRRFDYKAAAAGVPRERYLLYSKMNTDYRSMCKGEGIKQEDIPFTRGDDVVKVSVI